jgi:hypothetical protein
LATECLGLRAAAFRLCHHFTAKGIASPKIADELLWCTRTRSWATPTMLATRIVQLGGGAGFRATAQLAQRSH